VIGADLWLGREQLVNLLHGLVVAAFTKYTLQHAKLDLALAGPTFDAASILNWLLLARRDSKIAAPRNHRCVGKLCNSLSIQWTPPSPMGTRGVWFGLAPHCVHCTTEQDRRS
jgi:hypothetical protein